MARCGDRRVLEMYREADAVVADAGPVCVASGRCCRFKEYGQGLFLSNLEAAVLLEAVPTLPDPCRRISARSRRRACVPPASRGRWAAGFTTATRVSGNRQRITETSCAAQDLAEELRLHWRYAPLHQFLNQVSPVFRPAGRNHQGVTYV